MYKELIVFKILWDLENWVFTKLLAIAKKKKNVWDL